MSHPVSYFALTAPVESDELRKSLKKIGAVLDVSDAKLTRDFLESFDWRLYNGGYFLVSEQESFADTTQHRLRLLSADPNADNPTLPRTALCQEIPLFSQDLPKGFMRETLAPLLEMRALQSIARIQCEEICFSVLNGVGKTLVRVVAETNHLLMGRRKPVFLNQRLRVEPIRGYDPSYQNTLKALGKITGIEPCKDDLLVKALEKTGRYLNDYSSKLDLQLDPEMRTDAACRVILLHQLNQIERNIDGTVKDLDSEFLHDLRVAVRRSRSLLGRLKGAFPDRVLTHFGEELKWLGNITGPTRDMDVYLLDYPSYRDQLQPTFRQDLEPLADFLQVHQKKEQALLAKALRSKRFKDFLKDWRCWLESSPMDDGATPLGAADVLSIAQSRIWKTYRRIIEEGSLINDQSPAEALHDLRKTGKKLRYLLEFFASLFDKETIKGLVKELKGLQENLGTYQDLDVQAKKLAELSDAMMNEGRHSPAVFMAMGVLINGFAAKEALVRTEFNDRFTTFARPEVELNFRALCGRTKNKKAK